MTLAEQAQQEVIDLMNLLSAIEDPLDSLALAGVLRGPFFGVSDRLRINRQPSNAVNGQPENKRRPAPATAACASCGRAGR